MNEYLNEVMEQQKELERGLKRRAPAPARAQLQAQAQKSEFTPSDEEDDRRRVTPMVEVEAPAVDVRITGFWRFKSVVVPPNAYVIHTRRGHKKPMTIGLGLSFRYDPVRDSFLVVPASMQTITVSANCICAERQGVLVQGYVQWIIEDFSIAYRKLDFSDAVDPMRIVNLQLREQAEATIKDTVATMSVDAVLSDKQPIIKELTRRLREVAEGDSAETGLGLRIVTVQIKEAVVSSSSVWETLQRPFRAERQRIARLAELEQNAVIRQREAEAQRQSARLDIETQAEQVRLRAEADATEFDRDQLERARRAKLEAESAQQAAEHEREKRRLQAELKRLELETEIAHTTLRRDADYQHRQREIALSADARKVENDLSEGLLQRNLIEKLPSIVSSMPTPNELRAVNFNGNDHMSAVVTSVMRIVESFTAARQSPPPPAG